MYTARSWPSPGRCCGFGLRYYGQALTRKTTEIECTYQVHQHTEDCYRTSDDGEKELICGLADYVVHSHNDDCYNANGDLICPLKEIKEELHQHSDDCYTETEDGKKHRRMIIKYKFIDDSL